MKNTLIRKPLNQVGTKFQGLEWEKRHLNDTSSKFRNLRPEEIQELENNRNFCSDWGKIFVKGSFNASLIKNNSFYGLVRIGELSEEFLEYRDLCLPVGIYNSFIVSSDIGDFNAIHNVNYMANFSLGNEVLLFNIHEMETSRNAKFGYGVLKEGDSDSSLIEIELRNENGKRAVLPFEGMLAADAYLWSQYGHEDAINKHLRAMTFAATDLNLGIPSKIGDRCIIKNSEIIKDVHIGEHTYIKGVNKLKNITIKSSEEAMTQIGEGCELVNGIIGNGCRIFYGVKAVRFILADNSQLKYGARLINSYLGENSTISCCEVLNSLLFPFHEQHHNNSFLCASFIKGQSNLAAGATVGSNHNSRGADGELMAGRGFWPGLCVSLKHPSRFASYNLIVKGDFHHELDVSLPFTLISHDIKRDCLIIVPAYWFMYNMYALMRNEFKFKKRDNRSDKSLFFETQILAPDTVNEMINALTLIEKAIGKKALDLHLVPENLLEQSAEEIGKYFLENRDDEWMNGEIHMPGIENSQRAVYARKLKAAYFCFIKMLRYYAGTQIIKSYHSKVDMSLLNQKIQDARLLTFENMGGVLVPKRQVEALLNKIRAQEIQNWSEIHEIYQDWSKSYEDFKLEHALSVWKKVYSTGSLEISLSDIKSMESECFETKNWIYKQIKSSRMKDYDNSFRKMMYESEEEMIKIVGNIENDPFIQQQKQELNEWEELSKSLIS